MFCLHKLDRLEFRIHSFSKFSKFIYRFIAASAADRREFESLCTLQIQTAQQSIQNKGDDPNGLGEKRFKLTQKMQQTSTRHGKWQDERLNMKTNLFNTEKKLRDSEAHLKYLNDLVVILKKDIEAFNRELQNIDKKTQDTDKEVMHERANLQELDKKLLFTLSSDVEAFKEVFGCPPSTMKNLETTTTNDDFNSTFRFEHDEGRLVKTADKNYISLPSNGNLNMMPSLPDLNRKPTIIMPKVQELTRPRRNSGARGTIMNAKRKSMTKAELGQVVVSPSSKRKSRDKLVAMGNDADEDSLSGSPPLRKATSMKKVKITNRESALYKQNPYVMYQLKVLQDSLPPEPFDDDEEETDVDMPEIFEKNKLFMIKPMASWLDIAQEELCPKYVDERKRMGYIYHTPPIQSFKDKQLYVGTGLYLQDDDANEMEKMSNDVDHLKYLVVKLSKELRQATAGKA